MAVYVIMNNGAVTVEDREVLLEVLERVYDGYKEYSVELHLMHQWFEKVRMMLRS